MIYCRNCGAPLNRKGFGVCDYCEVRDPRFHPTAGLAPQGGSALSKAPPLDYADLIRPRPPVTSVPGPGVKVWR